MLIMIFFDAHNIFFDAHANKNTMIMDGSGKLIKLTLNEGKVILERPISTEPWLWEEE